MPAYQIVCTACVSNIELPSTMNSFMTTVLYNGTANDAQVLQTGRRVTIVTSDDNIPYTFTISEGLATSSSFKLVSSALRQTNFNGSTTGLADLLLLGAMFPISNLISGAQYYFRINAVNSIGKCPLSISNCGAYIASVPPSVEVAGTPAAPANFGAQVINSQTVSLFWTRPSSPGGYISAYRIDAYTKSAQATANFSFFGDTEIQMLSTASTMVTGGTFTVSFDSFSVLLPANVSAQLNGYFFNSSADLTPYLEPGDQVLVDGVIYTVASHKTRDYTGFFVTAMIKSQNLQNLALQPIYGRPRTVPLEFDVDPLLLQTILQSTPSFGQVWVDRIAAGNGYEWTVTFLTNPGRQPLLVTNPGNLLGPNPEIIVSEVRQGVLPNNFKSQVVTAAGDILNASFTNLLVGETWYFRVLAINQVGLGPFASPVSAVPASTPGPLSYLTIQSASGTSILATYSQDADPVGSAITGYQLKIQSSSSLLTGSSIIRRLDTSNSTVFLSTSFNIQSVTTSAFALPFSQGATFTLAVASFFGVFSTYIGTQASHPGAFDAIDGTSYITRSTTDPIVFHPHVEVTPGEFINVASQQFRVCMNQDSYFVDLHGSLSISIIPLCSVSDPFSAALISTGFPGNILHNIPVYRLDTFVGGVNNPLLGSSSIVIEFYDGTLNTASASALSVGDWMRSCYLTHIMYY